MLPLLASYIRMIIMTYTLPVSVSFTWAAVAQAAAAAALGRAAAAGDDVEVGRLLESGADKDAMVWPVHGQTTDLLFSRHYSVML